MVSLGETQLSGNSVVGALPAVGSAYSRVWTVVLAGLFATFLLGPYPFALSAGGVRVQLWRLVLVGAIAVLAPAVVRPLRGKMRTPHLFLAVGAFWLGWGMLSFAWTPSLLSGAVELVGLTIGLMMAVLIGMVASQSERHLRTLVACWTVALAAESAIALIEFVTQVHLPSPYKSASIKVGATARYMTGTLGNPNDVAAFLLLGLPFAIGGASTWTTRHRRIGAGCVVAMAIAAIVLSNSRLCTVGLGVAAIAYMLVLKRGRRPYRLRLSYLTGLLVPVALLATKPRLIDKFRNLANEWTRGGSAHDRVLLIRHGWDAVFNTAFRGIGIGGFEPSVQSLPQQLTSSGDTNPHNFVIELLSQYGLLVSLAFWGWFVLSFQAVRRERLRVLAGLPSDPRLPNLTAAVVGFVIFIPASSDPSSFIEQGTGWLVLGTLLAIVPQISRLHRCDQV